MSEVTVASYNVHGGVDGWGRPFDVVGPCAQVDADVLVLQEAWSPDVGRPLAHRVADELGYRLCELALARGRILAPPPDPGPRWGPRLWERRAHGMRLNHNRAAAAGRGRWRAMSGRSAERGSWGIAVLSRLPVLRTRTVDLGQLRNDPARRGAIVAELDAGARLTVVGTHFAHLSHGSPLHVGRLRRALETAAVPGRGHPVSSVPGRAGPAPDETPHADDAPGTPTVLVGDMNLWGPPLRALFPGWGQAVRGRTWPSWSAWPLAQSDHIFVRGALRVTKGEVLRIGGSDHFPVRATLILDEPENAGPPSDPA